MNRCSLRMILLVLVWAARSLASDDNEAVRVFIFAGQSNMVGSDSRVEDVQQFPPFIDAVEELPRVRFWYVIGREEKQRSKGWVPLHPVGGVVGPELSFARQLLAHSKAPLAIIKVAAGGTTLGRDWNPDQPSGFELYPLALQTVREALADLQRQRVKWKLEALVWHQGENDMFDDAFRAAYASNLQRFIAKWRADLEVPDLRIQIGELCEKTIWGMDNRERMYGIKQAQLEVCAADPRCDYVRTSHVAVESRGDVGLHYHYGTLGQLEHGVEHARSYLTSLGIEVPARKSLPKWPYVKGSAIELWVLAGHRNMEGERAFVADLNRLPRGRTLSKDRDDIAYRYEVAGGMQRSTDWEALGPAGRFDTFGPELSFGAALSKAREANIAILKFTHSGSQVVDWTPTGSAAAERNLYPQFVASVRAAMSDLSARGHAVRLAGIVYHLGENDMSYVPYRRQAAPWLSELIAGSRRDLELPQLRWFVAQQKPTNHPDVNAVDVVTAIRSLCEGDANAFHVECFDPPEATHPLLFDAAGVLWLGERYARAVRAAVR